MRIVFRGFVNKAFDRKRKTKVILGKTEYLGRLNCTGLDKLGHERIMTLYHLAELSHWVDKNEEDDEEACYCPRDCR